MSSANSRKKSEDYLAEGGTQALPSNLQEDLELTSSDSEENMSVNDDNTGYQEVISKKRRQKRHAEVRRVTAKR